MGHGLCISGDLPVNPLGSGETEISEAAAIDPSGHLRAIVRKKRGEWCPYRVFPQEVG
jgi:hypothetical protein